LNQTPSLLQRSSIYEKLKQKMMDFVEKFGE
jgi:hypothetical protein